MIRKTFDLKNFHFTFRNGTTEYPDVMNMTCHVMIYIRYEYKGMCHERASK
jgi:hypothetical protein